MTDGPSGLSIAQQQRAVRAMQSLAAGAQLQVDSQLNSVQADLDSLEEELHNVGELLAMGTITQTTHDLVVTPLRERLLELLTQHESESDPVRDRQQSLRDRVPRNAAGQHRGSAPREQPGSAQPGRHGEGPSSQQVSALPTYTHLQKPKPFAGEKADEPIRGWLTSMSHFLSTAKVPRSEGVSSQLP